MQHTKELNTTVSKALRAEPGLVGTTQRPMTLDILVLTLRAGCLTVYDGNQF